MGGIGSQFPAASKFKRGLIDWTASPFQIFDLAGLPRYVLVEPHIVHDVGDLRGEPL